MSFGDKIKNARNYFEFRHFFNQNCLNIWNAQDNIWVCIYKDYYTLYILPCVYNLKLYTVNATSSNLFSYDIYILVSSTISYRFLSNIILGSAPMSSASDPGSRSLSPCNFFSIREDILILVT